MSSATFKNDRPGAACFPGGDFIFSSSFQLQHMHKRPGGNLKNKKNAPTAALNLGSITERFPWNHFNRNGRQDRAKIAMIDFQLL
jgi:hypothetical protein